MKEKISLAGDLGSGKSTVSKILIEALGAEYYSTGAIVRSIAESHGMSIVEFNKYMETHPEVDHEIDDGIAKLSLVDKRLIIDSRMAWHFTAGTFKVYLSTDIETSALRIMNANRLGEHSSSLEDTIADTKQRRESEKKRYFEQYGVNVKDLKNYDLIVDTTVATPDEVAECIIKAFNTWLTDKSYKAVFISPERLLYPEREIDGETLMELSDAIEEGRELPFVSVIEEDGEFYLTDGFETAMAHSLAMKTFIRATLTDGSKLDSDYVKMKNSL